MRILLGIVSFGAASVSFAMPVVKTCSVGGVRHQNVSVIKDAKVASTYLYYLKQDGNRIPFFGTTEQSRGDSILVQCAGKKLRALIVSGEFTANALQGFVVTYAPGASSPERMDFAEKSRPRWLYLAPREIIVVFSTSGYGETSAPYVAYRHAVGTSNADTIKALNELPSPVGFEVVKLAQQAR
ncbi:hypothetical protein GM668_13340 [Duganella ginsengisoli]|uniref:Uncharacterized protein n=2 Tax=Pseudoduganella ginsengisoli TaxID=1462440 RepID=A0A6L6Q0Y8_9BURK|nr:hypothetical protein [Pseudoduganella ginsengisoli]